LFRSQKEKKKEKVISDKAPEISALSEKVFSLEKNFSNFKLKNKTAAFSFSH
jgi:hypothetical protein